MANRTTISNLTLAKLGQKRITSITEDSETARSCNAIYEQTRDEALADCPEGGWRFALHRATIAASDTEPEFGYDYQFEIPQSPKCIQVVSVQVDGTEITDWIVEGNYILTNLEDEEIDVLYVKQATDEGRYPPYFARYIAMMMAADLAYKITQNSALAERIQLELEKKTRPRAFAANNREIYVEEENNDWQETGHED